ncbi:hypothetical protein F5883DRAFT_533995 [Diaporthe sp. PMI_573]|nr:hypothetical protein F5883DRAFT_533995 [Diaporthaceae sp. PMI_573]
MLFGGVDGFAGFYRSRDIFIGLYFFRNRFRSAGGGALRNRFSRRLRCFRVVLVGSLRLHGLGSFDRSSRSVLGDVVDRLRGRCGLRSWLRGGLLLLRAGLRLLDAGLWLLEAALLLRGKLWWRSSRSRVRGVLGLGLGLLLLLLALGSSCLLTLAELFGGRRGRQGRHWGFQRGWLPRKSCCFLCLLLGLLLCLLGLVLGRLTADWRCR